MSADTGDTRRPRGRTVKAGDDGADPDDLERLLSAAGLDDVVQFYRHDAGSAAWVYLEQLTPAEIRGAGVREFAAGRYGGGKFKARVRERASGAFKMSRTFVIAGSPKAFTRDGDAAAAAASSSSSSSSGANAGNSIIEKVAMAALVPFAAALGGVLAKKMLEGPQRDPLMMELLRSSRSVANNGADPLELSKLLQAAEDRGERRGVVFGELKAAAESGGGGGGGDGWGEVLSNSLGTLEGIANRYLNLEEQRLTRVPRAAPLALVAETPAPAAASSSSSSSSAPAGLDTTDPLVQMLGSIPLIARKFILAAAVDGEDPAAYVPLILTKLEDDAYQVLAANIDREDLLEIAFRVVPKWRDHGEWFAALFASIRETIAAATPAAEESSSSSSSSGAPAA